MPNRYVREGAIESPRVNSLGPQAEVFWRRLLNRADDFGRYTASPELLRAALFPLQLDRIKAEDVEAMLAECEAARLVSTYATGDGKRYLALHKWEQGRAKKSRFPEPPADICERLRADADNCLHVLTGVGGCEQTPTDADNCSQGTSRANSGQIPARSHMQTLANNCSQMFAIVPDSDSDSDTDSDADPDTDVGRDASLATGSPEAPARPRPQKATASRPSGRDRTEIDAQWLAEISADPAYAHIDVARERAKMARWCAVNRKQPTRRRLIAWLNRIDPPLAGGAGPPPSQDEHPADSWLRRAEQMKREKEEATAP